MLIEEITSSIRRNINGAVERHLPPPYSVRNRLDRALKLQPGVSVVILTFNSARVIGPCIESVLRTLRLGDELVVVDNDSSDDTVAIVERLLANKANAKLLKNEANLGFSAGCNIGIRSSSRETILILNPDTSLRQGWQEAFEGCLKDKSVGAVGPLSDHVSGAQFVGFHLGAAKLPPLTTNQLAQRVKQLHPGRSVETKLLVGFCLAFRREVAEQIGLLDEDLFLGGEDLEFSLRLRANGLRLLIAQDVFVHHAGGASFSTIESVLVTTLLAQSTAVLHKKLRSLFAPNPAPSSIELFGNPILPAPKAEEAYVA
jgi:O-antigen biosynthesis protein